MKSLRSTPGTSGIRRRSPWPYVPWGAAFRRSRLANDRAPLLTPGYDHGVVAEVPCHIGAREQPEPSRYDLPACRGLRDQRVIARGYHPVESERAGPARSYLPQSAADPRRRYEAHSHGTERNQVVLNRDRHHGLSALDRGSGRARRQRQRRGRNPDEPFENARRCPTATGMGTAATGRDSPDYCHCAPAAPPGAGCCRWSPGHSSRRRDVRVSAFH